MDHQRDRRVRLQINGPGLIQGGRVLVTTGVNRTWDDLLNGELGLNLPAMIQVCTSRYRGQHARRGWSVTLIDHVRELVDHFRGRTTPLNVYLRNVVINQGPPRRNVPRANARRGLPDPQAVAQARLRNVNNNFLRRIRREIDDLRQRGLWLRNVMRAPRSCYLIEELVRGI